MSLAEQLMGEAVGRAIEVVRRWSIGSQAAAAFLVVAIAAGVVWAAFDFADEWAVNIATELGAVALPGCDAMSFPLLAIGPGILAPPVGRQSR